MRTLLLKVIPLTLAGIFTIGGLIVGPNMYHHTVKVPHSQVADDFMYHHTSPLA